jgi:hypothetical protein
LTWDILKTEFLKRTGHVAARTAHNALSLLLNGGIRQSPDPEQPVTQYLVAFQNKMREVGKPVDEAIAVELFLRGLLPSLRQRSLTDHQGCPHASLSAAFDYVRGVELQFSASKAAPFARQFLGHRQYSSDGRRPMRHTRFAKSYHATLGHDQIQRSLACRGLQKTCCMNKRAKPFAVSLSSVGTK